VSLKEYRAKRQFEQTPEPGGAVKEHRGPLRFVVQKHQASRLHFDLRLELGGSLKSWAVPKGPSLNPEDKRLAIMVEDHPLDYGRFEGVIPEGNYGAGPVMVWDEGTYHARASQEREESERLLEKGLEEGRLTFVLHGRKLNGEFVLVKLKRGKENEWLLMKKRDAFATSRAFAGEDVSAVTKRTMEEIAEGKTTGRKPRADHHAATAGMPRNVKPMLATPVAKPFDHPDWLFEIKWDGYRAIAEVDQAKVRLYSRKRLAFEKRFSPIVDSLARLGHEAVLDGEIVVLDEAGKPSFQLLQNYQKARKGTLIYQVFDLLYLDGDDLQDTPLLRRKEILAHILTNLPNVKLSEHIPDQGVAFFNAVAEKGLEGIVAKDAQSRYRQGIRSRSWLKTKTHLRQQAVIGGFTEPKGGRTNFGALVLGVFRGKELVYIGHAGSGFTEETLADLRARLTPLVQKACPFKTRPKTNTPARWARPRLVCEISFAGWTDEGHMRHPVFVGLRDDTPASEVRREILESAKEIVENHAEDTARTWSARTDWSGRPNRQISIGGRVVHVTNLNKLFWPKDGYVKGDLIEYYRQVAGVILPYLKDRPLSLHRHPNGIEGKSFFQKDVSRQPPPDWVQTVELPSDSGSRETIRSVLCQDEPTLIYLANLGCIELNPWNSRIGALDQPDYAVIDLDPEDVAFDQVVEAAQMVRRTLEQTGVAGYCKTSGKRGLHIYVPFGARYKHEQARQFAELIAHVVHRRLPRSTSLVRHPAGRQKRVYLDFLQNGKGKTLAAPYAVRPNRGGTVSTPLKWAEVKRGLDPSEFTIRTLEKRLAKVGDLWEPVLGQGIDLPECLNRLASVLERESRKAAKV
jgi:bifunctional non-homologous end joining protein LigD